MKSKYLNIRLTDEEKKDILELSLKNGYGENISQFVRSIVFQNNLKNYFESEIKILKNDNEELKKNNIELKNEVEDLKQEFSEFQKKENEKTELLFTALSYLVKKTKGIGKLPDEAIEIIEKLKVFNF